MKNTATIIQLATTILLCGCGHDKITIENEHPQICNNKTAPINLKIYVETSGGMDGFLCDGSNLRTVIYDYFGDVSRMCVSTKFYYVNERIVPFDGDIEKFKAYGLSPKAFKTAGSGRKYSDIAGIIGQITNELDSNTVSVFVSDCILDIKGSDAKKALEIKKSEVKKAIQLMNEKGDFAVEILKMNGLFEGMYYPPNGGQQKMSSGDERPYYIWIFGDRMALAYLHKTLPVSRLKQHKLQNKITFTKHADMPFEVTNTNGQKIIRAINGSYSAIIKADLSSTLQDDSVLMDIHSYKSTRPEMKIKRISKTENNSQYTHLIEIELSKNAKMLNNNMKLHRPELPNWIEESNDPIGDNAKSRKTFGIKYLIGGVAEAFENENELSNFKMKINNK